MISLKMVTRILFALGGAVAGLAALFAAPALATDTPLRFSIGEGTTANHFYCRGSVAAHAVVTAGPAPRVIVAFPAGNTGICLWFDELPAGASTSTSAVASAPPPLAIVPGTQLEGVERPDGLRGVTFQLRCAVPELTLRGALLANIRTIRDAIAAGQKAAPSEFAAERTLGPPLVLRRTTVDGRHHVELRLEPTGGTRVVSGDIVAASASERTAPAPARERSQLQDNTPRLRAGPDGHVAFKLTALADDPPLTPFAADALFTPAVAARPLDQQVFAFLASEEKFAAGSWRFLTYFGRDTLLSVQLLMPVLRPPVIEAALGSVIERLAPDGEVAHEEGIGEFATLENQKLSPPPADPLRPVLDYKMVDSAFLLAPAVAAYLLDTPAAAPRARAFLARTTTDGERYDQRLRKNLELVLARAAPFAADPRVENLIALKDDLPVGNWRDSNNGLGGGRYAFDINAALVPAALHAAARLYRSGLLGDDHFSVAASASERTHAGARGYDEIRSDQRGDDAARAAQAERAAETWRTAERFFRVVVPPERAKQQVADYATAAGLAPSAAVAAVDRPVSFHAVSLDTAGRPVPVMNTDDAFMLFFTDPAPTYLEAVALHVLRPFPAGLRTAVGLVVANPAYADASVQRQFTRADYHGTVVWSWQQALMAAGLKRQLARRDLPDTTRAQLTAAETALWNVITASQAQSAGELWTWEPKGGREALAPFGQTAGHADESNAAQLWSTVYLAVQPPRR